MFDLSKLNEAFSACGCGRKHECLIKDIRIGEKLVGRVGAILKENGFPEKLLLVADENTLSAPGGSWKVCKVSILCCRSTVISGFPGSRKSKGYPNGFRRWKGCSSSERVRSQMSADWLATEKGGFWLSSQLLRAWTASPQTLLRSFFPDLSGACPPRLRM